MAKEMIKVWTPIFRVSFPSLFKKSTPPGSDRGSYSVVPLFHIEKIKSDPEQLRLWKKMKDVIEPTAKAKFGKVPTGLKLPFRKGEEKADLDGYGPGIIFMNLRSYNAQPGIVDQQLNKIHDESEFYAGCWARATVSPYAWDNIGGKGVSFGLLNLQKVADDDPFTSRSLAENDFQALDSLEDDEAEAGDAEDDLFG